MPASLSKREDAVVRTFIAIELPARIRTTLAGLEGELTSPDWTLRWVAPELLHLTVRFLGPLSEEALPRVADAVRAVGSTTSSFALSLSSVGAFFAGSGAPRVIWVGLQRDAGYKSLQALFTQLENDLALRGFERESRRFAPHLTVARVRDGMPGSTADRLRATIDALAMRGDVVGSFEVRALTMMRSDLAPDGPIYTPIHRSRLVVPGAI